MLQAHDTVAQKDFDPILPPLPEDLPDDEEAMRIVCLVKNNQPLVSATPGRRWSITYPTKTNLCLVTHSPSKVLNPQRLLW